MQLLERIEDDFRRAMKAHDAGRVSALRMLRAALANAAIAARTSAKQALDEADVEGVIRQEAKKLKDALGDFTTAARLDLVEATKAEIAVLEAYVPSTLAPAALEEIVGAAVVKLRRDGVVDFGRTMGVVMREVKGRADGETVAEAVRRMLVRLPKET